MILTDILDQLPLAYEHGQSYALIFHADLLPLLEAV